MTPLNDRYYEIAHLKARIAGEESEDHPRQDAVRWLARNQRHACIAKFNKDYEARCWSEDPYRVYRALLTVCDLGVADAWWDQYPTYAT